MQRRKIHARPRVKVIPKRTYRMTTDMFGIVSLKYTGNQNLRGLKYHPTKGWRRA